MLVTSEDYNVCFMFNLPHTDIFSGKINVFHYSDYNVYLVSIPRISR